MSESVRNCYARTACETYTDFVHQRQVHPDRPGVGGSDAVELEKRVQIWLGL
jgi:hypothetical protein